MPEAFDQLIINAQKAEELSNQVKTWMADNITEEEFPSEAKKLNRISRELRSVQRAAGKRPSIFLFGASQVGKSYLVHNIAKHPGSGRCEVCIGNGQRVDFIDAINPPGGGTESTGISTRFRVGADPVDADFPFEAKLFNTVDVAAIAVNSYFNDLATGMALSEGEVEAWMHRARTHSQDELQPGLDEDAFAYFIEYCESSYSNQANIATLKRLGYFEVVRDVMPFLTMDERLQGLSFLWGGLPFWTEFVDRMWRALASIGYLPTVTLPVHSVVSADSLINVKLMDELLGGGGEAIRLKNGQSIPRSELAFLIRELELVLPNEVANELGDCLKMADLVDFPGARSRLPLDLAVLQSTSAEDQKNQTLCIRRGKVAYLFDLYNQELEIGCLLLCMDDGQPEVQTIPRLIQNWVHRNVGEDAIARKAFTGDLAGTLLQHEVSFPERVTSLFAVLTKFNRSMMPNEGNSVFDPTSENERIRGRFQANFTNWLQKDPNDKWLDNWDGQHFQNVYPVRDPAHSKNMFEGYEEHGKETGYVFGAEEKLNKMGQVFIGSDAVGKRIASPQSVWSQLTRPNKTGIEELMHNVAPAAHPALKLSQVKTLLVKSIQELHAIASKHHIAGDLDEELSKARELGADTRLLLARFRMSSHRKKLISLIASMSCTNELGMRAYSQTYLNDQGKSASNPAINLGLSWLEFADSLGVVLEGDESPANEIATAMGMDEAALRDWMKQKNITIAVSQKSNDVARQERHELFGRRLIAAWITDVSEWLNEDYARLHGWQPDEQEFVKSYVHSLVEGRVRSNIQSSISQGVMADFAQPQPSEAMAWHAATVSSRIINQYVSSFGLQMESVPVPASQDAVLRRAGQSSYWHAWTTNLQKSFEENIRHQFNAPDADKVESNRALGDLIGKITAITEQTAV